MVSTLQQFVLGGQAAVNPAIGAGARKIAEGQVLTAADLANQRREQVIASDPLVQQQKAQQLEINRQTAENARVKTIQESMKFEREGRELNIADDERTSRQLAAVTDEAQWNAWKANNPIDSKGLENVAFGSPEFSQAQAQASGIVAGLKDIQDEKAGSFGTFLDPNTGETVTLNMNNPDDVAFLEANQDRFVKAPSKIEQTTFEGGSVVPLSKGAGTTVQKATIALEESFDRVGLIREEFNRDFLTFQGGIKASALSLLDKADFDISPEGKEFLTNRKKFVTKINREFNLYRKLITGAAAAEKELADLKKATINEDLGPVEFLAALDSYEDELKRGLRLNRRLLREGIKVGDEGFGEAHDALWDRSEDDDSDLRLQELLDSGTPEQEAIDILISEGYE